MADLQIEVTPTKGKKFTFVPCDGIKPAKSSRGSTLTTARSGNPKRKLPSHHSVPRNRSLLHPQDEQTQSAGETGERAACRNADASLLNYFTPSTCFVWSAQLQGPFLSDCIEPSPSQADSNGLHFLVWFRQLPEFGTRGKGTELSSRAVVCAALARANHDDRMLRQAASVYVNALTTLNRQLIRQTQQAHSVATLITCLNLIVYGLYMDDIADFGAHTAGMSTFMQWLGPDAFREGEMHRLFLASRQYLVYSALCARTSSFLGDHAWLDIITERDKTAYESLLDIMTQLPGMRSLFVKMQRMANNAARDRRRLALVDQAWHLRAALLQWHDRIAPFIQYIAPIAGFESAAANKMKQPTQQNYSFASFGDASTLTIYWACLTEIYNILGQCFDALGLVEVSCIVPSDFVEPAGAKNVDGTGKRMCPFRAAEQCRAAAVLNAKHICSSVHYFISNKMTAFSLVTIVAPMKLAHRCFVLNHPASIEYLEWTHEILGDLKNTGVGLVEGLMADHGVY